MLNERVRRVDREKAGLIDPTDEQRKRPLAQHLAEFKKYLKNKGVTPKQIPGMFNADSKDRRQPEVENDRRHQRERGAGVSGPASS